MCWKLFAVSRRKREAPAPGRHFESDSSVMPRRAGGVAAISIACPRNLWHANAAKPSGITSHARTGAQLRLVLRKVGPTAI